MLIRLAIKNFALIDDIEIDFSHGLNILTGETGAGKSIIIDAIGIIVGERASFDVIRSGETLCEVEAIFDYDNPCVDEVLEEYGVDPEENTIIIHRQLTDQGRSFCRINGRSVPVSALKKVGSYLIDIHGQHRHQSLLDSDSHITFLDLLGDQELLRAKEEMSVTFERYNNLIRRLRSLKAESEALNRERERLQYEVDEIEQASIQPGEDILLEEQKVTLINAEKIAKALELGYAILYEAYENPSIVDGLSKVINSFEGIKDYYKPVVPAVEFLSTMLYEIEDLAANLRDLRENIDFDIKALDDIQGRIQLLDRLKQKYRMNLEELIKYKEEAAAKLEDAITIGDRIEELHELLMKLEQDMRERALALHILRKRIAKKLETDISSELQDLGMKGVKFSVNFSREEDPKGIEIEDKRVKIGEGGMDRVEFLISTNPGEPLKPLIKIVSGGETSRIMLAIKSIMAEVDGIPSLIFDEIDAGIGGRAAQTVGEKLSQIARKRQILCITHSPQIASQGDVHFLIQKEVN